MGNLCAFYDNQRYNVTAGMAWYIRTGCVVVTTVRADFEVLRRFVVEMARMLRVSLVVVEVSTLVVLGARHAARHGGRCVRHSRWPGCLQPRSIFRTFRQPVRLSRPQHTRLHVSAMSIVARHDLPRRRHDTHQRKGQARRQPHLKPLHLCSTCMEGLES